MADYDISDNYLEVIPGTKYPQVKNELWVDIDNTSKKLEKRLIKVYSRWQDLPTYINPQTSCDPSDDLCVLKGADDEFYYLEIIHEAGNGGKKNPSVISGTKLFKQKGGDQRYVWIISAELKAGSPPVKKKVVKRITSTLQHGGG